VNIPIQVASERCVSFMTEHLVSIYAYMLIRRIYGRVRQGRIRNNKEIDNIKGKKI
jgi:hypothetical protein